MEQNTINTAQLCDGLLNAESEQEVTTILSQYGLLEDHKNWRLFNDSPTIWSPAGTQQAEAVNALVEKLTNASDALLEAAVMGMGVDPDSADALKTRQKVLETCFGIPDGDLRKLTAEERKQLAIESINLIVSGQRNAPPCITIVDSGEGQTPQNMRTTFLSGPGGKAEANKKGKPYLQGIFNMGGLGVLPFAGKRGYQLIITKRHPKLLKDADIDNKSVYGFTIVRRRSPRKGFKESSVLEYLVGPDNDVLSFEKDSIALSNTKGLASVEPLTFKHGSLIKLYDYAIRPSWLATTDLYYALNRNFYEIPLPVYIIEARDYKAKSPSTVLSGNTVRLASSKKDGKIEKDFPLSTKFNVLDSGEVVATVTAFVENVTKDPVDRFTGDIGVMFYVNGQMHGQLGKEFFTRKKVDLDYLKDSLMVVVDCSNFDGLGIEETFMGSREQFRKSEHIKIIEEKLMDWLKNHEVIRTLVKKRQRESIKKQDNDNSSIIEIMQHCFNPKEFDLAKGKNLTNSSDFDTRKTKGNYKGRRFPKYFKLQKMREGEIKRAKCSIGTKTVTVNYNTDAQNDYFVRDKDKDPGKIIVQNHKGYDLLSTATLHNGICQCIFKVPKDARVGQSFMANVTVTDKMNRRRPFKTKVDIQIVPESETTTTTPAKQATLDTSNDKPEPPKDFDRRKKANQFEGKGALSKLLKEPIIQPVFEKDSNWNRFNFTEHTGLVMKELDGELTFYLNQDNIHLKREISVAKEPIEVLKKWYEVGMVADCLGIYYQDKIKSAGLTKADANEEQDTVDIKETINELSVGLARVVISKMRAAGKVGKN